MASVAGRTRRFGWASTAGFVVLVALTLSLLSGSASAQKPQPVAKVAPGVYMSKISAQATRADEIRPGSEPGSVLEAKRDEGPSSRIVGGAPTTIAEWPWQAALLADAAHSPPGANGFDRQFCGGTLVAPTAVISAAHCAFDVVPPADGGFDPIFFDVVTGRTVLSSTEGQELPVANYFVFTDAAGTPLFDGDSAHGWDAILIQLASSSTSQPINLAGPNEEAAWAPGRAAFTTGWGSLSFMGPFPDQLREIQIGMLGSSGCGAYGASFDPTLMVCAGVQAGGKDSCQGDSGGPLVVPKGSKFRLVGDTSFGNQCALPNFPGIYGRVAEDPLLHGLAQAARSVSGRNIIGTCAKDKKKAKKAKKKAKRSGTKKAKKKAKRAKRKARKAC
jgi:trypsin